MKNWLFPPEAPYAHKIVWSGLLGYFIAVVLLRIVQWPQLFTAWGGHHLRYARDLMEGSLALLVFIALLYFIMKFRSSLSTLLFKIQSLGLMVCFLFIPVLEAFFLGLTTEWFTLSPERSAESMKLYNQLQDIQYYLFITTAFGFTVLIWHIKCQEGKSDQKHIPA